VLMLASVTKSKHAVSTGTNGSDINLCMIHDTGIRMRMFGSRAFWSAIAFRHLPRFRASVFRLLRRPRPPFVYCSDTFSNSLKGLTNDAQSTRFRKMSKRGLYCWGCQSNTRVFYTRGTDVPRVASARPSSPRHSNSDAVSSSRTRRPPSGDDNARAVSHNAYASRNISASRNAYAPRNACASRNARACALPVRAQQPQLAWGLVFACSLPTTSIPSSSQGHASPRNFCCSWIRRPWRCSICYLLRF
jgi:hypothetical protein